MCMAYVYIVIELKNESFFFKWKFYTSLFTSHLSIFSSLFAYVFSIIIIIIFLTTNSYLEHMWA